MQRESIPVQRTEDSEGGSQGDSSLKELAKEEKEERIPVP